MALSQQRRNIVSRKQSAEHVDECSNPDEARDSSKNVNESIPKQRHDYDQTTEDYDAEAIVDIEQLTDCLTGQHAPAGRKADVHKAHRHDRNDCAIHAELHATRDHLGQPQLRALRRVKRHDGTADQLTQHERHQRPKHIAPEYHGERTSYDRSNLQVGCNPQSELTRQSAMTLLIRHIIDRSDLDRARHGLDSIREWHQVSYVYAFAVSTVTRTWWICDCESARCP